jgi:hypothetical protein
MFLNIIKVYGLVTKYWLMDVKPTIHRTVKTHPNMERGYFTRLGTGGKSGEPMLRVNVGNWYSSFPMYQRNGKTRVNTYVPIKGNRVQVQR